MVEVAVGWFSGVVLDAEGCELLAASGARAALVAFEGREGVPDGLRRQARLLVGAIDRGLREREAVRVAAGGESDSESPKGQAGRRVVESTVDDEISRAEAAAMLGVSPQRVSQMVGAELTGRSLPNGRVRVSRRSVLEEISRRDEVA